MSIQIEAIYEHGVFRPLNSVALAEGQHVSLEVDVPPQAPAVQLTELPDWCNVYEGLSDEEIAELEKITLDRSNFMRPPPVDEE